jgi:hypothetical protein
MRISVVIPRYLYAVEQVLPEELFNSIQAQDWPSRPYTRLTIGWGRRRRINHDPVQETAVNDYFYNQLKTTIEHECGLQFTDTQQSSFQYWLDEPGFRPAMHTDGDLASAVQIYLWSNGRSDLGTAFYHSQDPHTVLHTFDSRPNTGYIMFNQPEAERPMLWHDMTQAVPPDLVRLCLYVTFGCYQRVQC